MFREQRVRDGVKPVDVDGGLIHECGFHVKLIRFNMLSANRA